MLYLNARQPDKVLNGLNAQQSEIFIEFALEDSFKLLDGICRAIPKIVSVQDDEITELVYTIKLAWA